MGSSRKRALRGQKHRSPGPATRPSQDHTPAARDRRVLIGGTLVALAILVVYCSSLYSPFIFDDVRSIRHNRTIRHLWAIGSVLAPPAGSGGLRNRPVVNLSLAINYALGGEQVFGYHLFNVGVHILAALTLLGAVRRTLLLPAFADRFGVRATWYATTVALFWGLHPLGTDAVTYTIQRCESLFSMFYLLTVYCCVRGHGVGSAKGWFAAAIGSCLLGMGCKETMVTAPLVAVLYDRVFVARSWKEIFQRRWGLYAGLAATWILLGLLMAQYWGTPVSWVGSGWGMTWWEYARTQFWAICRYLRLAFWPSGLVFDYGDWIARAPGEIIPCAIVVTLLVIATLAAYLRWPWAGYLGTCFFVILAPTSSVVPVVTQTVAERRMYLPLAAVTALVVFVGGAVGKQLLAWMALPDPVRGRRGAALAGAVVACIAVALGSLTVLRNRDYRSDLAIWEDVVRKRPDNPRAYFNRGSAYGDRGAWDREIADCDKAIELKPDCAEYYNNRGNAYGAKGDSARAISDYSKAIELKPDYAEAYNNRGSIYSRTGDHDRAVQDFTEALSLRPDSAVAFNNRADAWNALGQYAQALRDCDKALALDPGLAEAYYHRGNAHSGLGDSDRALADYSKFIRLKPGLAEAYDARGAMYVRAGAYDLAVKDFTKAIALEPDFALAYNNRAIAYCNLKDYKRAQADVKVLEELGGKPSPQLLELLPQDRAAQPKP